METYLFSFKWFYPSKYAREKKHFSTIEFPVTANSYQEAIEIAEKRILDSGRNPDEAMREDIKI